VKSKRSNRSPRPAVEKLEDRTVPSTVYRTIDGSANNILNPTWGEAGADLLRLAPAAYGDGLNSPAGSNRPSARAISDAVAAQPDEIINNRDMSAFVYAWGQFIDHDLDLTTGAKPAQPFNIQVPSGDPQFDPGNTGSQFITLNRSEFDPNTGKTSPRQQLNDITAFLDGSMIYGSDATRAAALRLGSGGLLRTSAGDLLPFNTGGLPNANDAHMFPDTQLFLAGDVRANENVELTAIQTLFLREHNRWATQLATANPTWNDEQVFQEARRRVIAEIEAITYNEFLPALLGPYAPGPYTGYKSWVNPGIANEFSTAAFRIGHTLVGNDVQFLDNNANSLRDPLPLSQAFFNPAVVEQTDIDPILKYLATDRAQEVDTKVVDGLRNFLFGPPGSGGLDLASLNIQRGRDHGLADYNSARKAYGLRPVDSFADITSDPTLQQQLKDLYHNVNNIDLWVGGLAEDHLPGASVGPTFARIIADQFARLRDGDSYWYQRDFQGAERYTLENTTLADIIRRNTGVTNLQRDVFFFHATIAGRVFADANGNGVLDRGERGVAGITLQLLDANGNVLQTTVSAWDGSYSFRQLDPGTYYVREVVPNSGKPVTSGPIVFTRGMVVTGVNFAQTPKGVTVSGCWGLADEVQAWVWTGSTWTSTV
jgi:hypothetical protein